MRFCSSSSGAFRVRESYDERLVAAARDAFVSGARGVVGLPLDFEADVTPFQDSG